MIKYLTLFVCSIFLFACSAPQNKVKEKSFLEENIDFAHAQIGKEIEVIEASGKILNPVTLRSDSTIFYCNYSDWRSGFFPGSVWYLFELTGDSTLLPLATKYTNAIEEAKNLTYHHDIGFIINCSFGNGLRLTGMPSYKEVIIQAAQSLSTRFRPNAGVIQSWNVDHGWQAERGWDCPVIIDNMMNLELMFKATELSGDSSFYKIAVSHADRTLQEHFAPDGRCFHVVDYSIKDGKVRNRQTAQGYADSSIWSRGQAWAIYGYTICYRETKDRKYLDQALKTFNMMRSLANMPADLIPYWDMEAPNIPNEPRDVSSASCIASALYEISTTDIPDAADYKAYADSMLKSLASPAYRAALGTNGNFLLMHSVGSIPHNAEIDVPLNYADYYFLEALKRKRDIEKIGNK
jgi:rhamnogalacturonyl hydrolase YesR